MKNNSSNIIFAPIVDALIIILILVFIAFLSTFRNLNNPPVIKTIKENRVKIQAGKSDNLILNITDIEGDLIKIDTDDNLPDFVRIPPLLNDELEILIKPKLTSEKEVYDFSVYAKDKDGQSELRIVFTVIGRKEIDENLPPRITVINMHESTMYISKRYNASFKILDPENDEYTVNFSNDKPDFVVHELNDDILSLNFYATKKKNKGTKDFWIRTIDEKKAMDSLRITFIVETKHLIELPYCMSDEANTKLSIHIIEDDLIVCLVEPDKKNGIRKSVNILGENYNYGDQIPKSYMNTKEFKNWAKEIRTYANSGDFGDGDECNFYAYIYTYSNSTNNEILEILKHFYVDRRSNRYPLYDKFGVKSKYSLIEKIKNNAKKEKNKFDQFSGKKKIKEKKKDRWYNPWN